MDEIASAEDPFLGEKDESISVGMASSEKEDLHLAGAATEDEAFSKLIVGKTFPMFLALPAF